ncbi:MAG: hypothetical protein J6D31_04105 [Clostridia bacterium]|nr:hypothetical protein [Clostridia bacterium]
MYCIKCGVELSPGQGACPLCGTRVYHPDLPLEQAKPCYPQKDFPSEEFNRRGLLFVITILYVLPLFLPVIFELFWHGQVTWSGYVAGAVLLSYICLILPYWFRRGHPVIFLPCDTAAVALYLAYINFSLHAQWYWGFALPITLSLGAIVVAVVALHRYVHCKFLYIYGGGLILLGGWTLLLEFLIRLTFGVSSPIIWSVFSCASLFVLGMLLILLEIIKPLKESLYKMFFIGRMQ